MLNFILDFYCPNLKLCIEVDWSSHNNRSEQDDFRDYILLSELAIKTIRYRNWEVKFNLEWVKIHLWELITNLWSKNENFYI